MHKYRLVAKKGEGTFSEVLKAQCIKNSKYVAIKCMKNHFDSLEQVNNLREIQALRRLSPHPNIVKLLEVLYDQPTGRLALVFELMDMNIYELIRGRRHYIGEERLKHYMYQLMKAMDHMHRNGIFHRDIKPENILIMDDCLKLADFGSCRGIYSKQPYTEYISTRWYRAPECLLTDGYYTYKMDMWGVGCVFFEIVSLFPLFPGTNELDQVQKIHNIVGTPPPELLDKMKKRGSHHMDLDFPPKEGSGIEKLIPHAAPECVELICKLLAYNPDDRLSAKQALRHPYFREFRDKEKHDKTGHDAAHSGHTSPRFPGGEDVLPEARRKAKEGGKPGRAAPLEEQRRGDPLGAAASSTQLPSIAKNKEDDKENEGGPSHRLPEEASQASSLPSMLSGGHGPGPYGSGNGASHRGGEGKDEGRESDEASTGGSKGLPPIRNSYTLATLPTKSGKGAHYNAGQSRAYLKGSKLGKGAAPKAAGPPPEKAARVSEVMHAGKTGGATQRRGDHLKYVSPYSQKYIATQRTSTNYG